MQVYEQPKLAGKGSVMLAVSDISEQVEQLDRMGVDTTHRSSNPQVKTLMITDIIGNIRHASGFGGWFLRMMGFAGDEPHVPKPVQLLLHGGKEALRVQLLQWADLASLKRILVSHGDPIEDNPREVLRELATSLE